MKNKIIEELEKILIKKVSDFTSMATLSKSDAINPELAQSSKYETQAIEASYLTDGYKKRLSELMGDLEQFKFFKSKFIDQNKTVLVGSLVKLKFINKTECYFISPVQIISVINISNIEIKVISQGSPLGKTLIGLTSNEESEFEVNGVLTEFSVIEIL